MKGLVLGAPSSVALQDLPVTVLLRTDEDEGSHSFSRVRVIEDSRYGQVGLPQGAYLLL